MPWHAVPVDGPADEIVTSALLSSLYEAPIYVATVEVPGGPTGAEKLRARIALPPAVFDR
jgi:hypothetical protein